MLIIFDLDDTLIDTFGCSQPVKFKVALQKMIAAGLQVDNEEAAYKILMEINEKAANGKETVRTFLEKMNNQQQFYDIGVDAYYVGEQLDFPINALEGAHALLEELHQHHDLVIVSYNPSEEEQYGKMKKAGIKTEWFRKIIITHKYDKEDYYNKLCEDMGYDPVQVLVIGDKYSSDLLPAKKLGIKTVYMAWGRGKVFPPSQEEVDYMIAKLSELKPIVEAFS
jgi:FMN phosphatase YigB (HAD superfamily)